MWYYRTVKYSVIKELKKIKIFSCKTLKFKNTACYNKKREGNNPPDN